MTDAINKRKQLNCYFIKTISPLGTTPTFGYRHIGYFVTEYKKISKPRHDIRTNSRDHRAPLALYDSIIFANSTV